MMTTRLERFMRKVGIISGGCWQWRGYVDSRGYGQTKVNNITKSAHKVSYLFHVGPVPKGLILDHLCRNRTCVNPSHLEPVTQQVNVQRGSEATKPTCKQGHDYTDPANLYLDKHDHRICRACRRIVDNNNYHAARKRRKL